MIMIGEYSQHCTDTDVTVCGADPSELGTVEIVRFVNTVQTSMTLYWAHLSWLVQIVGL